MVDEPTHEYGPNSVTNQLPGTVTGPVVQAGTIRQVVLSPAVGPQYRNPDKIASQTVAHAIA
ncbi:hypothetical protein [Amycolatopsis sp.]|uniref:hypothetical protein n=1 Tax=Amycolatopsis sp. TaxID=37632 RepID=UPI002D7F78F0|nr:hypothetical protein [Amycolatopsis sp.]HET6708620.1 hypothetical protein [Amycolatopsis sp.]